MTEQFIECAFPSNTTWPLRRFPARAERFAVTQFSEDFRYCSVTHIATGKRIGARFLLGQAQLLAVIFDHILPGERQEEVDASFGMLPPKLKLWLKATIEESRI